MSVIVFASGSGSNFEALVNAVPVSLLICDRADAPVLERAQRLGVKRLVIEKKSSREEHEREILHALSRVDFNLICLAGYRRLLSADFIKHFARGSIVNIHPSLLPKHPGLSGYEESFADSDELAGITIHEVDAGMDTGKILFQQAFSKKEFLDFESFKAHGLKIEHQMYPQTVREILQRKYYHRLEVVPSAVDLLPSVHELHSKIIWLETTGPCAQLQKKAERVFCDPVSEKIFSTFSEEYQGHLYKLGFSPALTERGFLPGVTDNPASAMKEAWESFAGEGECRIRSGQGFRGMKAFSGLNPLLHWQRAVFNAFEDLPWPEVNAKAMPVRKIDLSGDDETLMRLNAQNWWALSLAELHLIRDYFRLQNRPATDVEMEIIAQTWSEHCKHKIFRAQIEFHDEDTKTSRTINSIFREYIKDVTAEIRERRKLDWLVSVFDDNAGVVRWDDQLDMAIKVETHNSPSALDPYGGALTGILGVNRDILGVGLGARPIANTNVFCLAPPELPEVLGEAWPTTLLSPARIREGVHAGVRDGGNKSGIPTVNGAFHYDVSFAGKPLVYCGTIGVLPRQILGKPSSEKPIQIGDHVVMVGGRIGKDGLHGATFSSMEWKEGTPASVVQIGDPLTQKRMMDFLLEARDLGLYSGITDNGAGGLSSSIGELCQSTGGAEIDLARAPTKYPGLAPWELMVSESQERMTVAVPRTQLECFLHLAQERGVEATALGTFTASGVLKVKFNQDIVAELPLGFLHDGLPAMKLTARWGKSYQFQNWCEEPRIKQQLSKDVNGKDLRRAILAVLSHENVRSHEAWVRAYDHEVQAASVKKPFAVFGSPCDAAIVALAPHGGGEHTGVAIASGLAPQLSRLDPWLMGVWAVDEAVRSVVCAGGDPDRLALVDNFCWPDPVASEKNPDGEKYLGMLVRTAEGLKEACLAYGAPLVSGKDSMKNDAFVKVKEKNIKISALPTLLMTAIAHVEDVGIKTPSYPTKEQLVVLLLAAPVKRTPLTLGQCFNLKVDAPGSVDLSITSRLYRRVAQAIRKNLIHSVHDVSEGGVITALAESALGEVGFDLKANLNWTDLFGEAPGMITLTVERQQLPELRTLLGAEYLLELGVTRSGGGLSLKELDCDISRDDLARAFKGAEQ